MAQDCLFCKIIDGEVPSEPVLSTQSAYAFRDIDPQAPTHVLIVPRRHVQDASAIGPDDGDLLADLVTTARTVADQEGLSGGYRLVMNVGDDAGNTVPHLHLHVLGGRPLHWPPG